MVGAPAGLTALLARWMAAAAARMSRVLEGLVPLMLTEGRESCVVASALKLGAFTYLKR